MGKTYRKIPVRARGVKWLRTPKYKGKLLDGTVPRRDIVTDYDDKPIAALKEIKHKI